MIANKIKDIVLYGLGAFFAIGFLWIALKFALPILLPFILAYALSYALRAGAEKLGKITKMNENILMALMLILGIAAIALFFWFGASAILREVREALTSLSGSLGAEGGIVERFRDLLSRLGERFGGGEEFQGALTDFLSGAASEISSYVAGMAANVVSALPALAFGSAVGIVSLFYFTFSHEKSADAIKSILPKNHRDSICSGIGSAMRGLGRFVRSYSVIIAVTFAELLVGFLLMRVDHAVVLAMFISVIDILPVLGVGTVLVPWAVACLVMGNTGRAMGLLILLAVIWAVRQPVESRLIGKGAGVHPIFALMAVYAGYRLAGVFGMIVAPTLLTAVAVMREERKEN